MIRNIIVHHSGGTDAQPLADSSNYTVQQCNSDHSIRFNMKSSLGWFVGYHYFIDKFGKITQTRKDTEEGAHCKGYNNTAYDKVNFPNNLSIGICLAGNFDAFMPTQAQINALKSLLEQKVKEYNIPIKNIVPHRKYANKTCYGKRLNDTWAQSLLRQPPVEEVKPVETWRDKWHKIMIAAGFIIKNGKYVYSK